MQHTQMRVPAQTYIYARSGTRGRLPWRRCLRRSHSSMCSARMISPSAGFRDDACYLLPSARAAPRPVKAARDGQSGPQPNPPSRADQARISPYSEKHVICTCGKTRAPLALSCTPDPPAPRAKGRFHARRRGGGAPAARKGPSAPFHAAAAGRRGAGCTRSCTQRAECPFRRWPVGPDAAGIFVAAFTAIGKVTDNDVWIADARALDMLLEHRRQHAQGEDNTTWAALFATLVEKDVMPEAARLRVEDVVGTALDNAFQCGSNAAWVDIDLRKDLRRDTSEEHGFRWHERPLDKAGARSPCSA